MTAPQMFRWKFSDGFDDNQWTDWHPVTGACTVCCCGGGPGEDGEHQAPAEYYEDGFLENGHTYCDPNDEEPMFEVEFQPGSSPEFPQIPEEPQR